MTVRRGIRRLRQLLPELNSTAQNDLTGRYKNSRVDKYLLLVEEQSLRNISKETCIASSTIIFELVALDKVGE